MYTISEIGHTQGDNTNAFGFSVDTPFASSQPGITSAFKFSDGPTSLLQPLGANGGPSAFRGFTVRYQDRKAPTPYIQQWNFTIQQALWGGWVGSAVYAGSRGIHLFGGNYDLNQLDPSFWSQGLALQSTVANPFRGQIASGPLSGATVQRQQLLRPFPDYQTVQTFAAPNASSVFHSFQASLEKRFSGGLSTLISFTGSKLITDALSIGGGGNATGLEGFRMGRFNRALDRRIDQDDVSRRLVVSSVYELPFGKGRKFLADVPTAVDLILGGWQVNGIGTFQTGKPLIVRGANNFTGISFPDLVRDPTLPSDQRSANGWFDTNAFQNPANFVLGNAPFTLPSTRGPGLTDVSFSLFKTFNFLERFRLETRWEMFNALNTVNLNNPNTTFSPNAQGVNTNANFGQDLWLARSPQDAGWHATHLLAQKDRTMNRRDFHSLVAAGMVTSPLAAAQMAGSAPAERAFDFVVYGGTAAGVTTAVAAAREGMKVVLLEPHDHVGGMVTGGLSGTDVGKREVIGGMALEFSIEARATPWVTTSHRHDAWKSEPRVAESVFHEMLSEANVTVLYRHRLKEKTGVSMSSGRIRSIEMENGARFTAPIFADCTYEGDLMAQAKVTYTVGREGVKQYGESLAGIRAETPHHQFLYPIPARDASGKLYPEIGDYPRGTPGEGDGKVQAYNFRVIASNDPMKRLPWPKPAGYDPARYELLALYIAGEEKRLSRATDFNEVLLPAYSATSKADINNRGGFSSDYIGKNWEYPDGNYATRERIWNDHIGYQQGFYYFLATDERIPLTLRMEVNEWGLALDEYEDTNYWPHQLYVREARRMVGEFVATQKDLQTDLSKPDAIGMGSYQSDSHNIQRIVNEKGFVENEGDVQVAVMPYQIPYRIMLPKREECVNLLAPVPFSASHIAYASMRMEPQWMLIGHAAGVAASMAHQANRPPHEIG
ncbi:MAG: FAD-dependent oxidoreductase [Bryobacterales bacterium]|nr:FAD-dependent oxidoreductase [Bryobacterales bacterium]